MLLVINVGNTHINGGIYREGELAHSLRIHTVPKKTEDEYASIFRMILADRGVAPASIDRVVLASVVPTLTSSIIDMCRHLFGFAPAVLGPALFAKLPIVVPKPREIGSDLVADALAAWKRSGGGACIVVDFGTAISITCVGHRDDILGVSIAPGLGMAINALSRDTAQLPYVQLAPPESVIGTDTIMSIQSGVVIGYVGLVEHLVRKMREEIGGEISIFATGGLCRLVAGLSSIFDEVDPDLTLYGLSLMADYA